MRLRFQAAESSICTLRAFAITVSNGGCVKYFQKEDTWYKVLLHLRCKIRFNPEIISYKFRGVVAQEAFYIISESGR
jgi:hypothetical protein